MRFTDYVQFFHGSEKLDSLQRAANKIIALDREVFEGVTDTDDILKVAKPVISELRADDAEEFAIVLSDFFSEYQRFEELKRIANCITCRDDNWKRSGLKAAQTLAIIELAQAIRQGKVVREVWEI